MGIAPLFWLARLTVRGRAGGNTPLDWPVLGFLVLLPLGLVGVVDWGLALPKLLGVAAGLALVIALARAPSSPRSAVRLTQCLAVLLGPATAAVGLVGTAWELAGPKLLVLGSVYDRLPRLVHGVAQGTEGGAINPNEIAGALVFFAPLLGALTVGAWRESGPGRRRRVAVLSLSALLVGLVLVMTQSRGGALGALVGLAAAGVWVLGSQGGRRRVEACTAAVGAAVIAVGASILFAGSGGSSMRATIAGRYDLWFRAVYMLQDSPWFGIGLGQFPRVVLRDYAAYALGPGARIGFGSVVIELPDSAAPLLSAYSDRIPHAHNFLLQNALDFGIPGSVAICAVLVTSFGGLWSVARRADYPTLRWTAAGLAGGMAGFLAYGLNDTIALGARGGLAFWVVLGLGAGLARVSATPFDGTGGPGAIVGPSWRLRRVVAIICVAAAAAPSLGIGAAAALGPCSPPAGPGAITPSPLAVRIDRLGDSLVYPTAVAIAELLEWRGCSPEVVAGRWSVAAAHVRTPSQTERVDAALVRQAARAGGPAALSEYLARTVGADADPRALCAIDRLRGRFCRPD